MRPAKFFVGLLFGALVLSLAIKLIFTAILLMGTVVIGGAAFRLMRRRVIQHQLAYGQAFGNEHYGHNRHQHSNPISLGQTPQRDVSLAMRRRTIEVL